MKKPLLLYVVLVSALYLLAVLYGAIFGYPFHVPIHVTAGFYILVIVVGTAVTRWGISRKPNA